MTDESAQIEDNGSSGDEECKTQSLQKMKATLPRSFEEKTTAPRVFVILE